MIRPGPKENQERKGPDQGNLRLNEVDGLVLLKGKVDAVVVSLIKVFITDPPPRVDYFRKSVPVELYTGCC